MTDELKAMRNKPVKQVVDVLEEMLKEAKNGDLRGFMAMKLFVEDGSSGQAWAGIEKNDVPKLLGELFLMASALSHKIDGVDSDDIRY